MIKNKDFTGSLDTNPIYFSHFNLRHFTLFYNGRPIPSEGLPLDMSHEKTSFLAYNTVFEGSGISHSNAGLQITHHMFIAGYFMLLFDLTPDSPSPKVTIRPLTRAIKEWNFSLTNHFSMLSLVCCTSNMTTVCE